MSNTMKNILKSLPLALVLVVGGLYMILDFFYVDCKNGGSKCTEVNGAMISHVSNPLSQPEGKKRLAEIDLELNALSANLSNKKTAVEKIQADIYGKDLEIAAGNVRKSAMSNQGEIANVNKLQSDLAHQKTADSAAKARTEFEANAVTAKISAVSTEANTIRSQFSARYSNRMLWIFLSAVLVMLLVASVVCAAFVIYRSQRCFHEPDKARKIMRQWLIAPMIFSVIFVILGLAAPGSFDSISRSVLETSIIAVNEISQRTIVFFITLTFASSFFLIWASYAISAAAVDTKTATPPAKADGTAPTEDEVKLWRREVYAGLLRHLRAILYVGTALLIIGIARLYFLNEWHLVFVSPGAAEPLKKFFESSMQMQGALYSIMLAAIYLAPGYWIREEAVALPAPTTADGTADALDFSYSNILVKLLAILSPLLLGSVSGELLKVFQ